MRSKRQKLDLESALKAAYRLLSYRLRSRWELRNRLKEKGFPPDVIDEVIQKLQDGGLLDDLEFAKEFVRSGIHRLKSPMRLRAELHRKFHVSKEIVEQALEEAYDWDEVAKLMRNKAKRLMNSGSDSIRVVGYFVAKGFSREFIEKVLGGISDGKDDF